MPVKDETMALLINMSMGYGMVMPHDGVYMEIAGDLHISLLREKISSLPNINWCSRCSVTYH